MVQTRTPLSRERVLRAAMVMADDGGLEALSMRKLADELGVKAMSLYNHVANKDDLIDGIVDAAWKEVSAPSGEADWKTQIRELAVAAHETMLLHPWASGLRMRATPGPARLRYGDSLLGAFRNAGFSKDLTYHAYHIVESYIVGFTSQVENYRNVAEDDFADVVGAFRRGDFQAEFPHFTEHALQHMDEDHSEVNAFVLGLDLVLDGLERLRDAED
jgi:AcrR family transcriptional regulator